MDFIGKIRDSLHNTIPYTAEEKVIIDRAEFQRLRRVHQTAFIQYVFPGATHTRFEHSLGAMHIAGLLYGALIANQKRVIDSSKQALYAGPLLKSKQGLEYLEKSTYLAQCLRFAALLHDCGHSPLSHSGERFMPTWQHLKEKIDTLDTSEWLKTALKLKVAKEQEPSENISHEVYTLLIISKLFKYDKEFLSEKMGQDICAVLDTSIPPCAGGDLAKSGMQELFHEVISGEIDVDRMDYLLRDSRECGVVYGLFDLGRILDSLGFYFNESTQKHHLALRISGISAYEDYLRARLSMYNQVYFHKTATACEAMLEQLKNKLPHLCFPLELNLYTNFDDYNVIEFFMGSLRDDKDQHAIKTLLRDLLLDRKLWKRVYEESVMPHENKNFSSFCPMVLRTLKEQNIPAELIETSTNLTRFSPKRKGSPSKNNFKVIIKNVHSLRYLDAIENHSNLINRVDEELIIRRIFIARYNDNNEEINTNLIQRMIAERISK